MLTARLNRLLAAQVALLSCTGLLGLVEAAVTFTTPGPGATIAGLTIDVTWADDGLPPLLTDLTTYKLFLCAGGNDGGSFVSQQHVKTGHRRITMVEEGHRDPLADILIVQSVLQPLTTTGTHTNGLTRIQQAIPASIGGNTKNA